MSSATGVRVPHSAHHDASVHWFELNRRDRHQNASIWVPSAISSHRRVPSRGASSSGSALALGAACVRFARGLRVSGGGANCTSVAMANAGVSAVSAVCRRCVGGVGGHASPLSVFHCGRLS